MDPSQGEIGHGKPSTPKLKLKDKVKNLKNRLPGMKKHSGEDETHEDSSEYDDNSPRGPGPEAGYNHVVDSAPYTPGKTTTNSNYDSPRYTPREVHFPDHDSRPSPTGYDSQNTNYVSAAPPTRPAPLMSDSPRSHLAPSLEEKFHHLGVSETPSSPRVAAAADPAPTDRGFQPEFNAPSTTESVQKGYSDDGPRNSFRSVSMPTPASANKGMLEKVKETVVGATAVLGDKMGYYNDHTPADPNAPSLLSKAKSSLGVDKPRDPNAPPLADRAKAYMSVATQKTREYSATAADHALWTKDRVAAQTTPTHHDKALSEQVTQSLSSLPGAIKEKLFGPTSPAPGGAPTSPGIVDRVSGAVSSLFTAAPKEHLQHTFPAHSDHDAHAAAAANPTPPFASAGGNSAADSTAVPPTSDYPTVKN